MSPTEDQSQREPWQQEPPQSVPPHAGPINWFAKQFPGQAIQPDSQEIVTTTLTQLRIDHGHGQFKGMFAPWDMRKFAEWLIEQATLAETNIQVAQHVPKKWPPGIIPPNGHPG